MCKIEYVQDDFMFECRESVVDVIRGVVVHIDHGARSVGHRGVCCVCVCVVLWGGRITLHLTTYSNCQLHASRLLLTNVDVIIN